MSNKNVPNRPDKYYQNIYKPFHPEKYTGNNIDKIWYRSKWEYKFCWYCDNNDSVLKWSSESIPVPYEVIEKGSPIQKIYYPDYWIRIKRSNGTEEEKIIEIKPYKQTQLPEEPKKNNINSLRNYEYELKAYQLNFIKWTAVENYCKKRGIDFILLTERYFDNTQIKLF